MTDSLRVFIAVELSSEHLASIKNVQQHLKVIPLDAKWVEPHNCHITLKFLGQTRKVQIPAITAVTDELAKNLRSFSLDLAKVGVFPSIERPNIIWVGLSKGHDYLVELAQELENRLEGLGLPKEHRSFHPHITIARLKTLRGAGKLPSLLQNIVITSQPKVVDAITLFESSLTPEGPRYNVLHRSPLKT